MASIHAVRLFGVTSSRPSSSRRIWSASISVCAILRGIWYLLTSSSTSQSTRGCCFMAHEERLKTTGIGCCSSRSARESSSRANSKSKVVLVHPSECPPRNEMYDESYHNGEKP